MDDICVMQGSDATAAQGQWAFINFLREADAERAFRELADRVSQRLRVLGWYQGG